MLKKFRKMLTQGKGEAASTEIDPYGPIFGDDFEFVDTPAKGYEPPPASEEILALVKEFEEQIDGIHEGTNPDWTKFFESARKLQEEYFPDHGESTALSDELMSVYELMDVESLYTDKKFMAEIVKILEEDMHFACFLLTSEFSEEIQPKVLSDFLSVLIEGDNPMDCEGCGMNQWWGNPLAYLAAQPSTRPTDLQKIFELAENESYEFSRDIVFCTLAQNEKTPVAILKKLAKVDRDALRARDEQCPFYDENNASSINIAYWAELSLEAR
jgi:hypothetical protein